MASHVKEVHLVENSLKMRDLQGDKLAPKLQGRDVKLTWSDMIDGVEDCEREPFQPM